MPKRPRQFPPLEPGDYWVYAQTGDRSLPTWLRSGWHIINVQERTAQSVVVRKPGRATGRRVQRLAFEGWRPIRATGQTMTELRAQLKGSNNEDQDPAAPAACPFR